MVSLLGASVYPPAKWAERGPSIQVGCPSEARWETTRPALMGPFFYPLVGRMARLISVEEELVQALKEYIVLAEAKLSMMKR